MNKTFEQQMRSSVVPQGIVSKVCEHLRNLLSPNHGEIETEDRYELESCKLLTYENVVSWLMRNKPAQFDAALMVKYNAPHNKVFPVIVGLIFISDNNVLLGKSYLKKIIYCTTMDSDLENLFGNSNSVIIQ